MSTRTRTSRLAGPLLGLTLGLAAPLAQLALGAVPEARADDAATVEATSRFEEGNTLWGQGKHEQARLKYVQAWAVLKKPGVLFNLARAEQHEGRWLDAYVHFREFLKMPQTDADRTALARKFLADLGTQVSLIALSPGTPAGTKVIVDGLVAGEAPLADPIAVLAGPHEVLVVYGDKQRRRKVTCPAQRTVLVERADTEPAGGAPPSPPPGEREAQASWTLPIVLGLLGAGGVGAGVALGALSGSADDELRLLSVGAPCKQAGAPACKPLEDAASRASGLGTGSVIGYVGGGVFLGAAVVSALVLRPWASPARRAAHTQLQVVPAFGAEGAGASVLGRF